MDRRLLVLLLIVQIGLGLGGLAAWAWLPAAPAPPVVERAPEPFRPTSLESTWPVAAAAGAAWLPETRLLHAALQIDWPWAAPEGDERERVAETGWVTYVFAAPWAGPGRPDGGATLSLLVERLSGQVVFQSTVAWETRPAATPLTLPAGSQIASPVASSLASPIASPAAPSGALPGESAMTSLRAVRTAELEAGAAFRHACPVYRHLTRVSLVTTPDLPPHWLVTYEDTRQRDRHGLIVRVDAASGEVLATGGSAPEC